MLKFRPYACRVCGATCYRRVIDRDTAGALRPTGLFHCAGCSVVFADPKAWRDGEAEPHGRAASSSSLAASPSPTAA